MKKYTLFISVIFLLSLLVCSIDVHALSPSQFVSWYYMNDSGGLLINSANGKDNLTYTQNLSTVTGVYNTAKKGNAIGTRSNTDGHANITKALNVRWNDTSNFSISFWLNLTNRTADQVFFSTMNFTDTVNAFRVVIDIQGSGNLSYSFNKYLDSDQKIFYPATNIILNQWTHIAATYNGVNKNMSLYINGVLVRSNITGMNSTIIGDPAITLFTQADGGTPHFFAHTNATIDELGITNVTLNASDILILSDRSSTTAFYPFTANNIINFQGQTPSTDTKQYYTNNSIFINTTAIVTNFTNTTINFYNTTDILNTFTGLQNQTTLNITGLTPGLYYYNATAQNITGGLFNTETRNITIYSITSGILTIQNSTELRQFLNITWTNSTTTNNITTIQNYKINLLNNYQTLNNTLLITTGNNLTNYNLYIQNYSIGIYYIQLSTTDTNNNNINSTQQVNITRNAQLNITAYKTYSNTNITNFTVTIYNINKTTTETYTTTNYTVQADIIRQDIYNIDLNATNFTTSTQQGLYNNAYNTITFYDFGIVNCTNGINTTTFTINYYDENSPAIPTNATTNIQLTATQGGFTTNYSYALPLATTHRLCLLNNQTVNATIYIQYTTTPGYTNRYYIYNTLYNTTGQTINLYDWTNTNASLLRVIWRSQSTWNPISNSVAKLQRNYVGEGVWRTVQEDLTDYTGLSYFHVVQLNTDYKLLLYDQNNNLLYTTDTVKFSCDIYGICDVTVVIGQQISTLNTGTSIIVTPTYNNNTGIITTTFIDSTGTNNNMQILVQTANTTNTYTICNNELRASSGTVTCNITGYSGQIKLTTYSNGGVVYSSWINAGAQTLGKLLGPRESSFWTFAIATTMVGAGFISPVLAIIMVTAAFIFIFLMGLFAPLNILILTVIAVISVVIAVKLKE